MGLDLLASQMATLEDDLALLAKGERWRGLDILSAQADEEAAKALMLLDFIRMDQCDDEALTRQLRRFYSHLARCIYAEVADMNPADFAEVRMAVDSMRVSHYLDGPNEVDWIFRNLLLTRRETSLYVDFIHEEDGDRWVTPASNDTFMYPPRIPYVRRLVHALHRLGVISVEGLTLVAEHWSRVTLNDQTRWQDVEPVNREIVKALIDRDLVTAQATSEDSSFAIQHWPFPMGTFDLSEKKVEISELEVRRANWHPDY